MIFEPKKRLIKHDENKRLSVIFSKDTVKYYRNCEDMYTVVPYVKNNIETNIKSFIFNDEIKDFDLYDINFLDFKITLNCFDDTFYEDILWKYLNFGNSPKVLHVVSGKRADKGVHSHPDMFLDKEWNIFCELLNDFEINNKVHLEIHNVLPETTKNANLHIKNNIKNDIKFDLKKFQIVDFHTIVSNNEAYYVNLKCDDEFFLKTPNIIFYNPFADRKGYKIEDDDHILNIRK